LEKKDEEELDSWRLGYGLFGYLVGYLEERNRRVFEDKALSFQDHKHEMSRLESAVFIG